jgi:hypothetical protein
VGPVDSFAASRSCAEEMLGWLEGPDAAGLVHAELEEHLDARGRELLRRMLQDHLSLRAANEVRLEAVVDSDGVAHGSVEAGHRRALATIFGEVEVERLAYRHRGHPNLCPADGALNLPVERHSHGVRRLVAVEACRGSFEEATAAAGRATGAHLGKRQAELLASRSASDVEEFYATRARRHEQGAEGDVLVISADGKGIVMRPDALRPATAKAAAAATNKLAFRLSKGEKRNRKRLAEVGAVYDLTPVARAPTDVLASKAGCSPVAGTEGQSQVGDRERGRRRRHGDCQSVRRGRTARPGPLPSMGGPRRRQQPSDRPHRQRGRDPRCRRHDRGRPDPRS